MGRLVVVAVVVLAAVAAADAFRPEPRERAAPATVEQPGQRGVRLLAPVGDDLVAVGPLTRSRVLRAGEEFLAADEIDRAFPAPLAGIPFDVAHIAVAPDGTVALGVYKFPPTGPARAAIELWGDGAPVSAFLVAAGAFAGGLGFAGDGLAVAALSSDGSTAMLYDRSGRLLGTSPVLTRKARRSGG